MPCIQLFRSNWVTSRANMIGSITHETLQNVSKRNKNDTIHLNALVKIVNL